MSRVGYLSCALAAAVAASGCYTSSGGFTLADSRAACMAVAGVVGGGAGSVIANNQEPRETDERLLKGGLGLLAGATVGYLICGEGGAVSLPTAAIRATPESGESPLRVTLMAEVPTDARITSYAWDLGDGTQAMGPSVAHTYGSADRYQVRLTVTDTRGRTALATTMIQSMPPAPQPQVSAAPPAPRKIVLRGVNFAFDSSKIARGQSDVLDFAAEQLRENARVRVRVSGHTDARGSDDYNLGLSRRRAEAVVAYLASHGIARERSEALGLGESAPVASNESEDGRAQNRRVELEVVE